jgi:hypothetical protein
MRPWQDHVHFMKHILLRPQLGLVPYPHETAPEADTAGSLHFEAHPHGSPRLPQRSLAEM